MDQKTYSGNWENYKQETDPNDPQNISVQATEKPAVSALHSPLGNSSLRGSPSPSSLPNFGNTVQNQNVSEASDLQEYNGPQLVDYTTKISLGTLDLPTVYPYHQLLHGDPAVLARRAKVLEFGVNTFSKLFLSDFKPTTSEDFFRVFNHTLAILGTLLRSVDVGEYNGNVRAVYRLRKGPYWTIFKQLDDLRKSAQRGFDIFGTPVPPTPSWGGGEDPLAFYSANDFEILAVCFRAEVENYLEILNAHYNFIADEPRAPDEEIQAYYDEYRRSLSAPEASQSAPHHSSSNNVAPPLSPTFRKASIKREDSQVQSELEYASSKEMRKAAAAKNKKAWVEEVVDEDDIKTQSNILPQPAAAHSFAKSASPGLRYREALGIVQTEDGSKSIKPKGSNNFSPHENQREYTPGMSGLGFALPSHFSGPRNKGNSAVPNKTSSAPNPGDDPSDSDDDSDGKSPKKDSNKPRKSSGGRRNGDPSGDVDGSKKESEVNHHYFDQRLKIADIPEWDGNPDTLMGWINQINLLAEEGPRARQQLGRLVHRRFTGYAENWFFSLSKDYQKEIMQNWDTFRQGLAHFFMSAKWLDRTRKRALRAKYRQSGHGNEKPAEYYMRKLELLTAVYALDDTALISEVMSGAPRSWCTVLDTQKFTNLIEFHSAIIFHEDTLMDLAMNSDEFSDTR